MQYRIWKGPLSLNPEPQNTARTGNAELLKDHLLRSNGAVASAMIIKLWMEWSDTKVLVRLRELGVGAHNLRALAGAWRCQYFDAQMRDHVITGT